MKQFTMTTIPLLCAAIAPLCADSQGSQATNKPADQQQMMNQITPSGEPAVTRWADPFITADFIWWRAQEDGLDYAVNGLGNGSTNADKGSVHHPHFQYEPGFKVGAGLKFRHDGWDLYAQYTWLRVDQNDSKSSVHTDADGDSNVQSNIFIPGPGPQGAANGLTLQTFTASEAEANWSLHFNVLDLELGRNFWISKNLTLRPYVGMKFSWNDQDFNVEYEQPLGVKGVDEAKMRMDLDQSSVGLRTGLNTQWYMWKKWCIFGELAISGILNDFDSSRKDVIYNTDGSVITLNHIDKDSHSVTAVLEWALGLRFETAFHNDDFMFMLQAGWEEQIWFNQNQFVMMPNSTPADLSLQGLTIKAGFYF